MYDAAMRSTEVWKTEHDFQAAELEKFEFLYHEWSYPWKYADFKDKDVLDAGSGPRVQVRLLSQYASHVTAVDLEAIATTRDRTKQVDGAPIEHVQADIAAMDLGKQFDVVNCVGVIHHTDDPSKTFQNLARHVKPGGIIIIWAYAREGNWLMEHIVEPLRQRLLARASHDTVWRLSLLLNALMWLPIQTIFRLPLRMLPYYEYFGNSRKMSFRRNALNIYDKLNAPQQHFIPEETIRLWFDESVFEDVHISLYKGVSWRGSGRKRMAENVT